MKSLLDRGILSTRQRFTEDFTNTELTDRILHEYGDSGYASKVQWKSQDFLRAVPRGVAEALQVILSATDNVSKYAADSWMTDKMNEGKLNLSDAERDVILREQIGSPAYSIKGSASALGNMIFPFMSSIMMATRGDWRAWKRNPTAWALGAGTFLIPSIIQGLIRNGAFDGNQKDDNNIESVIGTALPAVGGPPLSAQMRTKDSRTHNSNWVIPMGINKETGDGTALTFPLPQNPALRMLHVTTLALIDAIASGLKEEPKDKDLKEMWDSLISVGSNSLRSVMDVGGTAAPNLTPAFTMPADAVRILAKGNTYEDFTGRMKFRQNIPEGEQRLEAAAKGVMDDVGLSKNFKHIDDWGKAIGALVDPGPDDTDKTRAERLMQVGVTTPFVGDAWNRLIKTNNTGFAERNALELQQKEANSILRRQAIDDALEGNTDKLDDILTHPERGKITPELIRSRQKALGIKNLDNPYLQNILKYGTNTSVDETIQAAPYSEKAAEAMQFIKLKKGKSK
jgi:hypothetical protein